MQFGHILFLTFYYVNILLKAFGCNINYISDYLYVLERNIKK